MTPPSCSPTSGLRASGRNRPVLVPNEKGLDRALEAGVQAVAVFGSATETFARNNLGRGVDESIEMFRPVVARAREAGLWVRGYVSMCFGDPWEGDVPVEQVVDVAVRLNDLGLDQLCLGDTIGVGTTGHVHRLIEALDARGIGVEHLGVHFHDTYGQALTNTLAALARRRDRRRLVRRRARRLPLRQERDRQPRDRGPRVGADGAGVETGVDLAALVETSVWMAEQLGRPSPSRVVTALAGA